MRILGFIACCAAGAGLAGCQPIAAVLDKVPGDPVISAVYVPAHDNILVIVEDYQNPALIEETAEHVDWLITNEFVQHKVAPVINPNRLTVLRTSDPQAYRRLKIPQIGRELGARQVMYANVTEFTVESAVGTDALKAHAEARVKIVDCASGQTRWPRDATSAGFPISVDIPFAADDQNADAPEVRTALAQALATRIATLFYDSSTDEPSPAPKYPESDQQ